MILRAAFWIGLVSLLTPHEPDLGLGRPGAGTLPSPATILSAASGLSRPDGDCGSACAGAQSLLGVFHLNANSTLAAGLADVRAQIRQDRAARAARGQNI